MTASIQVESPPCPLCGNDTYQPVIDQGQDLIWRKPGQFDVQRCTQCGLVATRPRPTADSLTLYYEDTYSGESNDGMKHFQTQSAIGRWIAQYRTNTIRKVREIHDGDHILDVGCSYGGFLEYARTTYGCRTSGIDADAGSIADAVSPEHTDYQVGFLETAGLPPKAYSIVTFFESLEHHANPVAALTEAHRILEPGGLCVVEVPNFGGFWRRVFGRFWLPLLLPQHLYHFTPKTLEASLKAAGFSEIRHHQTMFYPLEGIASLGLALGALLRSPPPGSPVSWRTPFDLLILLVLVILYPLFEIPSQALLRATGGAGHQLIVGQKPVVQ